MGYEGRVSGTKVFINLKNQCLNERKPNVKDAVKMSLVEHSLGDGAAQLSSGPTLQGGPHHWTPFQSSDHCT